MKYLLEIAAFNLSSALEAAKAGADRIELCENHAEGGVTPSYGALKLAIQQILVPVFPIIRPRGGDFLYDDCEFNALLEDVTLCKTMGFPGIVTGILMPDGRIDVNRMSRIAESAYPMELTCHRAFDRTPDPFEALEDIIACGFNRVLTSGQAKEAIQGLELIKQLVAKSGDRIIILPGAGITSENIKKVAEYTGVSELHSSARKQRQSLMDYQHPLTGAGLNTIFVDVEEVRKMKTIINSIPGND